MTTSYNQIAGQSAERLAALSDGVFAVAMTLLVLDLRAPAAEAIHSEHDLWHALLALSPRLLMYMMSFMTLGIFWVGQQTQLNHLRTLEPQPDVDPSRVLVRGDGDAVLHRAAGGAHRTTGLALVVYWLNIFLLGSTLYWSWVCALGSGLVKADVPAHVSDAIKRRIVVAQSLYAFGALLCVFNPYWSIGFIVLVQLNYVIAPRWGTKE